MSVISFTNLTYLCCKNLKPTGLPYLMLSKTLLLALSILLTGASCFAQENEQVYIHGRHYLDLNIRSLDKYAKRIERTQHRLLHKLKRKEERLAKRLFRTDSAAYARLKSQPLSFDSISRLSRHSDSATLASKAKKGGQKAVDSLKGVYAFVQSKASGITNNKTTNKASELADYDQQLNGLQGRLSYDQYINELTNKHALNLQGIAGKNNSLTGIQKEVYYAKAKMNEWKQLADDPSKLEERALEYLQGTKGFDLSMKQSLSGGSKNNSMANAGSAADLEAMGFQTKRQLNNALQQKFGSNLQSVQGNMGKELNDWQGKAQGLQGQVKETKQSLSSQRHTEKPKFKVNPMRGKPFWMRIEKQYSFNTSRATTMTEGTKRPALLTLAASAAYKHTPRLSTGIGIAGDMGLGQNWSSIRFTFEGIGIRSFVTWEWQYGIGAYAGYERTFKKYVFQQKKEAVPEGLTSSVHNKKDYSEAALIGLTKKYKINSKWNGAVQVLYDVWWQDKGLRSPIVLRFTNIN